MDRAKWVSLTSSDRIAAILKDRIIRGEIGAGSALRQDHIAEEFGTSHVPVREAFQRLEAQGLAVSQPRKGMRVAPFDPASIRETVEMRLALETLALKHAAPRMQEQHIRVAEEAHARCNASASLDDWDQANTAFHQALVSECGMPRLLATLERLWLANSRFVLAIGQVQAWQPHSNQDHQLIIDALKSRNTERAVMLLGRHIGAAERIGFPEKLPVAPANTSP